VEEQLRSFLTSVLDEDEWSDSRSGRFKPWKTAPYYSLRG